MSKQYIYGGAAKYVGRFGYLTTGRQIELTDKEVAAVGNDPEFFEVPARGQLEKKITGNTTLDSADSGKKIISNHTDNITVTLPAEPEIGDRFEIYFGEAADPSKTITVEPGDNAIDGVSEVSAAAVDDPGTGYDVADTMDLAGGTGTAAVLEVATIQAVAMAVVDAGTGYEASDVLTVQGGTGTAVQITVDTVGASGEILTAHISTPGSYTVKPANPASVTGGAGSSATFNLTWGVLTVTVQTAGAYTVQPADPVAQGATSGTGQDASFNLTWVTSNSVVDATDDSIGLYWNGSIWKVY